MPCLLTDCEPTHEVFRFVVSLIGIYIYQYVWDRVVLRRMTDSLVKSGKITVKKSHQMRESLWKNVAVATFFIFGLNVALEEPWFMDGVKYWDAWPWSAPTSLRWYYMVYAAFWVQSIDFLLSLTNEYYVIKRKDNMEMLIHHMATLALMLFSFLFDFTKIGICVLMIHDVNDLLLETAKIFVYLDYKVAADVFFGTFALVWYIVRWGFFAHNIIRSVYYTAYDELVVNIYKKNGFMNQPPQAWYGVWVFFLSFLCLLLILHIYWGYLIGVMVYRAVVAGKVEKDIRSDSEDDEANKTSNGTSHKQSSARKRTKAPKAE